MDDNNFNLAIGNSRQRILNSPIYSQSKIFCFNRSENIASYQPALFMQKTFQMNRRFDKIIRNAFESGLIVKWSRDSQRKKEREIQPEIIESILLKEMAFLYILLLFPGSFISILSFLCELIIHWKMRQSDSSRTWKYFEQFFDGKRHYLRNLPEKLLDDNIRRKLYHNWY